ncbi:SLAM family member 5-like isoform X2 [Megalobrama amblycephala]|uniref:SLAM family member 5-like isoform X2 n=1 Tax=Megalobrama amblycephala TaxID=75352 RepID=UPI00201413EF|nr:SLAM family member 5-like isoform X2 [Megalobrama amblycephala]
MIRKSFFFCLWIWFSRGVFGDTDEVKSVSVMEGDSVTLNTDVTEVQKDDQILWVYRLNSSDIRIAQIYKQIIDMYDSEVMFGDRLRMDTQSGSLTIRNIRTTDSGLYKLSIFSRSSSYRHFSVNVYAHLPIPVIIRDSSNCSSSSSSASERSSVSRCSLVCSAVNVSHVTLSWYKGNSLLSSISVSDLSISLSLPLEVEYQDKNTYSCVINNPIRNQTQHLDINRLCHTCPELKSSHWVGILVSLVILAVLAVAAIIFLRRKSKQAQSQNVPTCEEEVCYTETTFRARSVHSTVRHCISVCRNLSFYHRRSEKSRLRLCVKAVAVSSCADKANGEDHIIYSSINVT